MIDGWRTIAMLTGIAAFVLLVDSEERKLWVEELKEHGATLTVAEVITYGNSHMPVEIRFYYRGVEYEQAASGSVETWKMDEPWFPSYVYVAFPKGNPETVYYFSGIAAKPPIKDVPEEGWTLEELRQLDPNFNPPPIDTWANHISID